MGRYRDRPTRAERARVIAAVAAIHLALGALVLSGSAASRRAADQPHIQLIDVVLPPPPPPPAAQTAPEHQAGAAGQKAEPSPIVVPPPKIIVPPTQKIAAAPTAGTGTAATSGAAAAGSGPGAGGAGSGSGGGGSGGAGMGENARLLSGGLDRRDYRRLRPGALPAGSAVLAILIGPEGRVMQCSIRRSSGEPGIDAALCDLIKPRMRWSPARDRAGRAITVGIDYTAVWREN